MKDAVDLLNERIANLEERNKALVEALEKLQANAAFIGNRRITVEFIDKILKEHGGER
jgi:chromosomal replication initiation ATPase DnaA